MCYKTGSIIAANRLNWYSMRTFIAFALWFILLVLCWPLAILMIFLFPLFWLILLPFKIIGLSIDLLFKVVGSILLFPFKVLGVR